jgi:uncharacterized Zn finger protein (UPF0148 family)
MCPHCGATVPDGAVYCGNCGAAINAPTPSMSTTAQTQTSSQPTAWSKEVSSGDMQTRYEKAMRRAELLGYAVAGLGVVIIVALVVLSLLP